MGSWVGPSTYARAMTCRCSSGQLRERLDDCARIVAVGDRVGGNNLMMFTMGCQRHAKKGSAQNSCLLELKEKE